MKIGFNSRTGEYVAIKILDKISKQNRALDITAAKKEFKIHSSVSHQNIIKFIKSAEDESRIYFVLEYAAAGELFDKIGICLLMKNLILGSKKKLLIFTLNNS